MHLVDEQHGLLAGSRSRAAASAMTARTSLTPAETADSWANPARWRRPPRRERRLAGAGRAVEQHRRRRPALHQPAQRRPGRAGASGRPPRPGAPGASGRPAAARGSAAPRLLPGRAGAAGRPVPAAVTVAEQSGLSLTRPTLPPRARSAVQPQALTACRHPAGSRPLSTNMAAFGHPARGRIRRAGSHHQVEARLLIGRLPTRSIARSTALASPRGPVRPGRTGSRRSAPAGPVAGWWRRTPPIPAIVRPHRPAADRLAWPATSGGTSTAQ